MRTYVVTEKIKASIPGNSVNITHDSIEHYLDDEPEEPPENMTINASSEDDDDQCIAMEDWRDDDMPQFSEVDESVVQGTDVSSAQSKVRLNKILSIY